MGELLQAPHRPLVPEVIRKGLGPLRQQLEDLGGDLPDSHLMRRQKHRVNRAAERMCERLTAK